MLFRGIAVAIVGLCGCGPATPAEAADDAVHIHAYYQGTLFSASYREWSGSAPANQSVSTLYQSDPGTVSGSAFVSVLGGNVEDQVWREVQVSGNQCAAGELCAVPFQLKSAEEILSAVDAGKIHLVQTSTICNVLGLRPMKFLPGAAGL
jgi:hypothetical protein